MMPFEEDDPEALMAQGIMPNTPRNPEKEAERMRKMKEYLQPRMNAEREQRDLLRGSGRDANLLALMNQAANQAGTVGGRSASSQPVDNFLGNMQKQTHGMVADERAGVDRNQKIMEYFQKQGMAEDKATAEAGYRSEKLANEKRALGQKDEEIAIRRQEAAAKGDKASGMAAGLKALDTDFAKDYNDWTSTGKSSYQKNMNLLEEAKNELEAIKGNAMTSGRFAGRLPDVFRPEDAIKIQQKVHAAAVGAMKAALGSAFTEKEGTRIMNLSYDPTLEPEANLEKIEEAIADIVAKANATDTKSKHFEQNQTLKGFKDQSPVPAPKGSKIRVSNGSETFEIDKTDLQEAEKDGFKVVQ